MSGKMNLEVIEVRKGDYRWRLRDQDGQVVSIKPGKIFGLGTAKQLKPYRDAAKKALSLRLAGQAKQSAQPSLTAAKG